ncbi:MAG TPA: acyl carrier protein [Pyrinomonadaceae bacterium]|nr:acyl carrier protein [Pyrinomonadaceae bacterium]
MSDGAVESIENTVKDIVVDILRVDRTNLGPATHLMKDLGADSLDALDVALRIEKVFAIQIPDDSIKNFLTIGDIVRGISEYKGVSGATTS